MKEQTSENFTSEKTVQPPYVGLVPFTEADRKYFFGRKKDIEIAASNLRAIRLTVFYGTSGVGKSSLINAGVIPYLRKIAAVSKTPKGAPEFILVSLSNWANDPLDGLRRQIARAVFQAVEKKQISDITLCAVERMEKINEGTRDLTRIIKSWTGLTKTRLLIILDQFEDFFLRSDFAVGTGSFGEEFPKLINIPDLPVNFIISMRDDAISKLDFFKGRIPNLMDNTLRLSHLDRQSAEEAIRDPLKEYERKTLIKFEIDDSLVERLLDDTKIGNIKFETQGQAVADPVNKPAAENEVTNNYQSETPYLQLVLRKLWEDETTQKEKRLTEKTLETKGGVSGIVKSHLDEVMKQFDYDEKKLISKFIRFTITRTGAKNTFSVSDIVFWTQKDEEEKSIENILNKLSEGKNRIFKPVETFSSRNNDHNTLFYQVTHDALGPAILNWSREFNTEKVRRETEKAKQKEIEKEKREKEEQIAKLRTEQEKRAYQEKIFDVERKSRRLGRYVFVLSILLLASSFFLYTWHVFSSNAQEKKFQMESSKKELAISESDAFNYKSIFGIFRDLQSDDPNTVSNALISLKAKMDDKDFPEEYKPVFEEILRKLSEKPSPPGSTTSYEIKEKANASLKSLKIYKSVLKEQVSPDSPKIIYIQIQNISQRVNALAVKNLLDKEENYIAPGIENVGERKDVTANQLRYFYSTDAGAAQDICNFLKKQGIQITPKPMQGYERKVRQNQFELWFSGDAVPTIREGIDVRQVTAN